MGVSLASAPLACCSSSSSSSPELPLTSFALSRHGSASRALPFASVTAAQRGSQPAVEAATPKPAKAAQAAADKPLHDVMAGALARAISQATIHPIDTLKVRLQAGRAPAVAPPGPAVAGVAGAVQGALREAKSLYKGVAGAATGAGIIIGAFFAFYSTSKRLLREKTELSEGTVAFIAGAVAAVGSSVVKVPIAVCIRSVQAGIYPNVFAAAASVVAKAGPRGLFTGFLPTLLEDVPDMAVKFAVYETLRAVHMRLHHDERPSTLEDLLMGGIAGSAAAAATTPLDVVKTRMMCAASSRPSLLGAVSGCLAEANAAAAAAGPGGGGGGGGSRAGGLARVFFRGVGPRALSNGLNSAIFYCWFEILRARLAAAVAAEARRKPPSAALAAPSQPQQPPQQPQQQTPPLGLDPDSPSASSSAAGGAMGTATVPAGGHGAVASCSLSHALAAGCRGGPPPAAAHAAAGGGGAARGSEVVDAVGSSSGQLASASGACSGTHGGGGWAGGAGRRRWPVAAGHGGGRLACLSLAIPLGAGGCGAAGMAGSGGRWRG